MPTLSPETTEALNALLEEERAGVQCEVALAGGATEYAERKAFTTMGREDVEICAMLHERLSQADVPVSSAVSGVAEAILAAEQYDERLRAFAEHQRAVSRRAMELAPEVADAEARQILERLSEMHVWHALWAEQRADEFAATRFWENGRKPRDRHGSAPATNVTNPAGEAATGTASPRGTLPTARTEAGAEQAASPDDRAMADGQSSGLDGRGSSTSARPGSEADQPGNDH